MLRGDGELLLPVAALQQLTQLDLRSIPISSVPGAVVSLAALQVLDIKDCAIETDLLLSSTTITSLALDDDTLLASLQILTGLAALRSMSIYETGLDYDFDEVCDLLTCLAAIPSFEVLTVHWVFQDSQPFVTTRKVMEALNFHNFDIETL
ncbi:hypothetical protein N2152v2_010160 [Parachlorella kessleri]